MGRLVHILHIETKGCIFCSFSFSDKIWYNILGNSTTTHKEFIVYNNNNNNNNKKKKKIFRTTLGIGPRRSCKGWFVKLNILPILLCLYIFSLIIFVFNNLDNFKANSLLHDFNTRSKNQLPFSISETHLR